VELDEVDVIDTQSLERRADLVAGTAIRPLAGLRREKETVAAVAP
jgi:hypothetical protein